MPQTKKQKVEFNPKKEFDIETINHVEKKLKKAEGRKLRSKDMLVPTKYKLYAPTPDLLREKRQKPGIGSFHSANHTIVPYTQNILTLSDKTLVYKIIIRDQGSIVKIGNNKTSFDNSELHIAFHNYNALYKKDGLFFYSFWKMDNGDKDYRTPNIQILEKKDKPVFRLFTSLDLNDANKIQLSHFKISLRGQNLFIRANKLLGL